MLYASGQSARGDLVGGKEQTLNFESNSMESWKV